jgi:predicted ArsR family transcriptional regulator
VQTTRRGILEILKKDGQATVTDLAAALKVTPMGVRQHLGLLERDGLVAYSEVRRKTGRPHYSYHLTVAAEELFPKSYHLLAGRILEEVRISGGQESIVKLLHGISERHFAPLIDQFARASDEERVIRLVAFLNQEGFLAEWEKRDDALLIHEYNCPYFSVAGAHPEVCTLDKTLLSRTLSGAVEQTASLLLGERRCTFVVRPTTTSFTTVND